MGMVTCCHTPGKSMNLKSTILAPCFLASSRTSLGVMPCTLLCFWIRRGCSDSVLAAFTSSNANDLVDRGHEDFAIPDAARARGALNHLDDLVHHVVFGDDLDLDLGDEVHHVRGAAIDFLLAAGAAEALDLGHRHSLDADFGQSFFDLVQLEGLDD